jgi:hypothetical protein
VRKILLAAALFLVGFSAAAAQSVQQSGTITRNHAASWATNGVIQDAGTASNPVVTSFGVLNNGGPGLCVDTGPTTAAGYQQFCLSASLNGAAQISLQNYGSATAQNICFNVNGTQTCIPTGGGTGTIPTITTPTVLNAPICAADVNGNIKDCTTGTNGQLWVGATSAVPTWVSASGDVTSISSAGAFVIGKVNGVTYPASPSVGTAPYVSSTNTITYGAIPATGGGTGVASPTAHGVLIAQGSSAMTTQSTASVGLCLLSNGTGSDPTFQSCASGSGSAAGSNTQVQYNNSTALAGSPNFTWVSPALTIGQNATTTGQLVLANGGATGTSVTIQNNAATSAYNFNLPATSGSSGQPMISAGGGSSPMTFGTLGILGGGTNCASASGTCLDNITGFSSTGFINRTGSGTYSFTTTIGLINGGTGANLAASNGGIVYSGASALAILSGTATANQIILSGSSSAPSWSTATYPATTTINQLLYSSSGNTLAGLATANSGVLITSAGGVPSISSTLPSAVQGNITTVGTIGTGVWQGTPVALAYGGTNANLTASNGGIFYSTASAGAVLAGTATANLPLLSGSSTTPSWSGISYPASATSGGVPYFSSTSAMASSALLVANAIVVGGGAGTAPKTVAAATLSSGALSLGTNTSVLGSVTMFGNTSGSVTVTVPAVAGTSTNFTLPATNGTSTQFLQTDGSGNTSWQSAAGGGTVTSVSAGTGMSFSTITASGSVAIDGATAGNFEAGTANKVLTSNIVFTSETTTTYGSTTTFDMSTFFNTQVTLTGNITTATCSNIKAGQSGTIRFIQDGSGSRTAVWCSQFKWAGGTTGTLTTTASAVDALVYSCSSTSYCVVSLIKNVS